MAHERGPRQRVPQPGSRGAGGRGCGGRNFLDQGGRLSADGTTAAGGTVRVDVRGSYIATAAAVTSADGADGGQVTIDGGGTGRLFSSGSQEALGRTAAGGSVTLRGGNVVIVRAAGAPGWGGGGQRFRLVDPHPTRAGAFGFSLTPVGNGNVVMTNPHDDLTAADAGAVYLFQGQTGALLGCLVGSAAGDQLGEDTLIPRGPGGTPPSPDADLVGQAVVPLTNGNYVVLSPNWDEGRGAATWGDGTAGVRGAVDASNSLVGDHPGDVVGFLHGVTALTNGNYVVRSPWNGQRGAVT